MLNLTEAEKEQLLGEVRKEFPDDEMMQEIHYSRLLHYFQTTDLPPHERVKLFNFFEKIPLS
jgi:hypothetical protein